MAQTLTFVFGVFLNDLPYFWLAMVLMWDYLRISKRLAFAIMVGLTALHAASIFFQISFNPDFRSIQIPHETFFLTLFIAAFLYSVRIRFTRLLFMAFFVKHYADTVTSVAKFLEIEFWPVVDMPSFSMQFNLMHLLILVVTYYPMYRFIKTALRPLFMVESTIWRFLWLLPAGFYVMTTSASALSGENIHSLRYIAFTGTLFVCSILMSLFTLEVLKSARTKAELESNLKRMDQLLMIQGREYERLAGNVEQAKASDHDLRHQLTALIGYLQNGNAKGAQAYCEELLSTMPMHEEVSLCKNFVVNAVALHYHSIARHENIDVSLQLLIPEKAGRVQDRDLCVVVGNLLENAIEACRYLPEGERFIRMAAREENGYLSVVMDNSFDGMIEPQGDAYRSRKHDDGNGVGLSSVKRVSERYNGASKFEVEGKIFRSSVLVKM